MSNQTRHDPYEALRYRDFRLLLTSGVISSLGGQMLSLAIGWQLYERTNSALALGLVGLVQLIPVFVLTLITGHVADRYNRKTIVLLSKVVAVFAALGLAALSIGSGPLVEIYGCLLLLGIAQAFGNPAGAGLPAEVVPEAALENSATWTTSIGTFASVIGPAIGGLIIAAFHTTTLIYLIFTVGGLMSISMLFLIRGGHSQDHRTMERKEQTTLRALVEGIAFLRRSQVILSAITLDLFAVLFGGATTLLPIFAKDILQVGPSGLGLLQAATSFGAMSAALTLAHRAPLQNAGRTLLMVVGGFGMATIVFGLSRSFLLSLIMLFSLGALDGVSMIIRDTLMLTRTPHDMRGRVAAIEGLFVNSSNQLGGFESGVTAQLFGPVLSVVGGGVCTILVVLLIATSWPELRRLKTLREVPREVTVG